jgi:hypothetical protein
MRLVTPPLTINESDAFANDALDRKAYGEALLNLVQRSNDELVISLDGQWGEGKTTFVKMWQGLLSEASIPNIYIDAFANDYLDDAFISIASAITSFVEKNIEKESSEKAAELKSKTKKIGGQLLSWSTKVAVKAATLGVIKESEIGELIDIKNDLAKGASNLLGNIIEERLASHSSDIELIEEFRKLLSEIPSKLQDQSENPLVIIIDELDRCKPSFAVEILEKIKHLFSVKKVVFILVMHKEQLEEAVRCIYGEKIDAHTYLQKFINLETKLPKRTTDRYSNDLKIYSRKLLQLHEMETWGDDENIVDCANSLANHFNLSLRQLEKVFTNMALLYGVSGERNLRIVPIMVFLSVIKVFSPKLFDGLLLGKLSYSKVIKNLNLSDLEEEKESVSNLIWLLSWVKYALLTESEFNNLPEDEELKTYGQSIGRYNINRQRLIFIYAQQLCMFVIR